MQNDDVGDVRVHRRVLEEPRQRRDSARRGTDADDKFKSARRE